MDDFYCLGGGSMKFVITAVIVRMEEVHSILQVRRRGGAAGSLNLLRSVVFGGDEPSRFETSLRRSFVK
jgi:hypothetical protein